MIKHMNNLMGKLVWVVATVAVAGTVADAASASKSTPTSAELEPLATQAQLNDVAAAGDGLIAVGVPLLGYVTYQNGPWVGLLVLMAGMSVLRWPLVYVTRWMRGRVRRGAS